MDGKEVPALEQEANAAKEELDKATGDQAAADTELKAADDDSYNQFKEAIDAVKGAIVSEDDANAKYTEAEAESVVAEAEEKTKKEAYDNALTAYASVHEHCGHDEMQVSYSCTQGNGNVWTKGSGVSSDFTFTRAHMDETAFDHFTGVLVDGKTLDKSAYTASAGSVVVKLSDKFLETLAVGDHTIKAEFDDGSAEAKFTVRAASGSVTVTETKKTTPVKTVGAAQQVITTPSANVQTAQKAPAKIFTIGFPDHLMMIGCDALKSI